VWLSSKNDERCAKNTLYTLLEVSIQTRSRTVVIILDRDKKPSTVVAVFLTHRRRMIDWSAFAIDCSPTFLHALSGKLVSGVGVNLGRYEI
jgi:hypothetical protein